MSDESNGSNENNSLGSLDLGEIKRLNRVTGKLSQSLVPMSFWGMEIDSPKEIASWTGSGNVTVKRPTRPVYDGGLVDGERAFWTF